VEHLVQTYDVLGLVGNGASIGMLNDAGIEEADVFIAVTESDELNLLCCMFAKKAGHCHAIARVRNPSYSHELEFIKQQIGISAIINPEMAAAKEISRLLRFPGAAKIDTFAEGRVRLIKFVLTPDQGINGMSLQHIRTVLKCDVLICAVEREGNVVIPDGKFTLHNGDVVTFLATQDKAREFFTKIHLSVRPVHNAMLVGGGAIGYYLAKELIENKIQVRIVERSPERCDTLTEMLPEAQILCGDGSNRELLMSEGLPACEAFVALTNIDEENVLLTLFAKKHSKAKLVTKVNRLEFDDILGGLELGSTIYPKYMTCDYIVQYVRALQNEAGSNVKTLYRILDDRVEALEFTVHEESAATRAPLSELRLKPNQLVCCITRGDEIIIPRGSDQIRVGDSVIVVTLEHGLHDVRGIVAE
jgi:trk system potassium uptake protein TrkA